MQKAIRKFIEIQSENKVPLDSIEHEIDLVEKAEIERASKKQRIQWRKLERR